MCQPYSLFGMTAITPAAPRLVLADRIIRRSIVTDVALVVGGTLLTAALAQLQLPMWPVPITGQTLAVLLVGAALGPLRGSASMALYLVSGLIGLPFYAPNATGGHTTGLAALSMPSFGYIVGFVLASAVVGAFARRAWDRRVLGTVVSYVIGSLVIYAVGASWLFVVLSGYHVANPLLAAITGGVLPFLVGDAVKAVIAGALLPGAWKLLGER